MTCDRSAKSMRQVTFHKRAIAIITDLIWNGYSLWGTYQKWHKVPSDNNCNVCDKWEWNVHWEIKGIIPCSVGQSMNTEIMATQLNWKKQFWNYLIHSIHAILLKSKATDYDTTVRHRHSLLTKNTLSYQLQGLVVILQCRRSHWNLLHTDTYQNHHN